MTAAHRWRKDVSVAERIRRSGGWSRVQVAGAAGCDVKSVQRIEQGKVLNMSIQVILRVADALGVAGAELIPALAVRPRQARCSLLQMKARGRVKPKLEEAEEGG